MCGFDSDFFPECKSGMYYFGSDQSSVPMNKAWNDIFTHLGHAKDSDQTELIAKLFFLLLYIPCQQVMVIAGRSVHLTTLFPGQA